MARRKKAACPFEQTALFSLMIPQSDRFWFAAALLWRLFNGLGRLNCQTFRLISFALLELPLADVNYVARLLAVQVSL